MKSGIKKLLKHSGVPLQVVADRLQVSLATVSRALDEDLINKVQNKAIEIVEERNTSIKQRLESLKHE